jgi:DNA polymerase III subunit gamma/tau
MSYEVTATKKRPQNFDELTGQDFVVSTLKNSIKAMRIAHAYLFAGPRGVGKTSAARILAKALNCEKGPTETPCGECTCCAEIARGASLDVIEIDGASNTSVNDVREIKDEVLFAPNSSRYKIYIIDEVHMLSNSAFNALLKTIEEPPPYIVFIFATTEVHKVPATIRSRCQQFNFKLISPDLITEKLYEACGEMNIEAEEDALLWIAKEATGSLRDAYTLFDQVISFSEGTIALEKIREKLGLVGFDRINQLVEVLADGKTKDALEYIDTILQDGVSVEQFIVDLTEYFRNMLFIKNGISRQSVLGVAPERFSSRNIEAFTHDQLEHAVHLLLTLYKNVRFSLNQKYELELTVSRLTTLRHHISHIDLVGRIQELQKRFIDEFGGSWEGGSKENPAGAKEEFKETEGPVQETAGEKNDTTEVPWDEIVSGLKKTKVALTSALTRAVSWKLDGDRLIIVFHNEYDANSVRKDIQTVAKRAVEVIGKKLSVDIQIEKKKEHDKGPVLDEQAELVKKVFKGEIVQGG